MSERNRPLSFSIVSSLKGISRGEWDSLFGEDLIEGYGYHKTLEEAKLKEFSFGYLLGNRRENTVAIIPFFVMNFSLDTLIAPPLHRIAAKLKNLFKLKILFFGSPTCEEFYLGISKSEELEAIFNPALEKISEFCRQNKIKGVVFNNLSEKNKHLAGYLKRKGFFTMETLPSTVIKIEADSLAGYINGLSRNMRKDLKQKLKKSAGRAKLTTELRTDILDICDDIYKLYLNNFDESEVHFEILTSEFFRNICANMPGIARFFITYDGNKIVAFNLCLVKKDLCIDKFIGFDLQVAHEYHLYFTTLCHNIDWCIKNGIRFYQPGATDYHPKMRLGAKLIPLYVYVKAFNPALNSFFRLIAGFIEPKNLDTSYKEIEQPQKKVFRE